jgi:hypothetical protein
MRVFVSWSGERSHAVAIALKTFVGDIVQSVTPFVSDEDIISGERWTSRIQEELQENQYGILSITHDNKESPWLLFEAGALSNSSYNIPVVPFLFDIEPSELTGSPLLQFQATIYYNKSNVRKLIGDINEACGEGKLDDTRLQRAFDRCYPEFENTLKQIEPATEKAQNVESDKTHIILEEVLDITRNSQKLLSNDMASNVVERIEGLLEKFDMRTNKTGDIVRWRGKRKMHLMMLEELLHFGRKEPSNGYGVLIVLSLVRDDLPWLYDAGKDLLDIMKSKVSLEAKQRAKHEFVDLVEYTFHNPMFSIDDSKEEYMMLRKLPMILSEYLEFYPLKNENTIDRVRTVDIEKRQRLRDPKGNLNDE